MVFSEIKKKKKKVYTRTNVFELYLHHTYNLKCYGTVSRDENRSLRVELQCSKMCSTCYGCRVVSSPLESKRTGGGEGKTILVFFFFLI